MSASVETAAAVRGPAGITDSKPRAAYVAVLLYGLLGVLVVLHHEPWADEAHSWLLARDASLTKLWTNLLHYEGTPGLWQTLLHFLIAVGAPYSALNFISLSAGAAAAVLLIRYSPWPMALRLLLPFSYYLFYQYGVIARSYALLPLLVFACAATQRRSTSLFTVSALLLAAVSLDGFILAVLIFSEDLLGNRGRRRARPAAAAIIFVLAVLLLAWSAWPARDNAFVTQLDFSWAHMREFSSAMIRYAFTGEWIGAVLGIAISIPLLRQGRMLFLFAAFLLTLCIIHSIVYMHVWHFGALTLAWLYCLWGAAERSPATIHAAAASLAVVIVVQCYWTVRTSYYDWIKPYSGSKAAAAYLRERPDIESAGVRLGGFSTEAVKPYFTRVELERIVRSNAPAYWDWSVRNTANETLPLIQGDRPGYLLAGFKLPAEERRWNRIAQTAGYRPIRRFEGNLFWRTRILEPESYVLYRRTEDPPGTHVRGALDLGDPASEAQLLHGFYDPESGSRWTGRLFSLVLRCPPNAQQSGAALALTLEFPEVQIHDLGPMTLTAGAQHVLASRTFRSPGEAAWLIDVPPAEFQGATTAFYFSFDKARPPFGQEKRELAALVKSAILRSK